MRFFILSVIAFAVAVSLFLWAQSWPDLIGPDDTVRLPLTWSLEANTSIGKLDTKDPLIFGMNVVSALTVRDDDAVENVAKRFAAFMGERNERGYWNHEAYGDFPEGWYSGMDFASMSMAALAIYQANGDERFLDTGHALVAQMIRPIEEGGVNHRTSKAECWLGEYVWPGMEEEDQDFVLNGALLSLLALETFVKVTGDKELKAARDCALAGIQTLMPAYFYADGSWNRYKLNPAAPQMTHYQVYEINEFDALFAVTGNEFYRDQAADRRYLMARHFKVYRDGEEYFFSQLGAPHPFVPDIYGTRIVFKDDKDNVVGEDSSGPRRGMERFLMTGALPLEATKVDVYAYSGSSEILLFDNVPIEQPHGDPPESIKLTATPALDLVAGDGNCYMIEPERMVAPEDPSYGQNWEGRLNITFDPVTVADLAIFTLDAVAPVGMTWAIGLQTKKGNELFRYIPPLKEGGRKTVPLSRLGFQDPGYASDRVVGATIYLYTSGMEHPAPFCMHEMTVYPDYFAFGEAVRGDPDALLLRLD